MTREEAKKLSNVLKAYSEGKIIQYQQNGIHRHSDLRFYDCPEQDNITFNVKEYNYRIKPEPKYRPFKNQEECWNEMLEHKPFSFVVNKDRLDYCGICRVFKDGKGISKVTFTGNPYCDVDMEIVFDRFNFADGTPFGIKEE